MEELLIANEIESGLTVQSEPPHAKEECTFTLVTGHNPTLPLKENILNDKNHIVTRLESSSTPDVVTTNSSFNPDNLPRITSQNDSRSEMGNPILNLDIRDESPLSPSRRNSADALLLTSSQHQSVRRASINSIEPILGSPRSPLNSTTDPSLSPRFNDNQLISHHALERLGVDMAIVKKEKGMKKLGISDVHIQESEEIQRYSGVVSLKVTGTACTKAEAIFGFTNEQLSREKAMVVLGTSEEEILDAYARKLSTLGAERLPIS